MCPAQRDVQPTLTYVLELYQLGGEKWPDRVMAWTAFPAVDMHKNLVSGRFKAPLIRGTLDQSVDTYSGLEHSYGKDLDRWLSNIYFEVVRLPKEEVLEDGSILMDRMIEMDYTRNLLSLYNDMSSYTNNTDGLYIEEDEENERQKVLDQDTQNRKENSLRRRKGANTKGKEEAKNRYLLQQPTLKINVGTLENFRILFEDEEIKMLAIQTLVKLHADLLLWETSLPLNSMYADAAPSIFGYQCLFCLLLFMHEYLHIM